MKTLIDVKNPRELVNLMLAASQFLTVKKKAGVACSGHGVWIEEKCVCSMFYRTRPDCSIHDIDYEKDVELAKELVQDLKKVALYDTSKAMNYTIVELIASIAGKADLLDETSRQLMRTLLYDRLTKDTPIEGTRLATALDSLAILTSNKEIAKTEYKQLTATIDILLEKRIKAIPGLQKATFSYTNYRASSYIYSQYSLESIAERIEVSSVSSLMKGSKGHVVISVVEWHVAVYGWSEEQIVSDVVSVCVKNADGKVLNVEGLEEPVVVNFNIDVNGTTAFNLTTMRCMSYNETEFSPLGMATKTINLKEKFVACQTHHLTDFAVVVPLKGSLLFPTITSPLELDKLIETKKYIVHHSPLFWFTIATTVICVYFLLWSYCKEKAEKELRVFVKNKAYALQKLAFQDSENVTVKEYEVSQANSQQSSEEREKKMERKANVIDEENKEGNSAFTETLRNSGDENGKKNENKVSAEKEERDEIELVAEQVVVEDLLDSSPRKLSKSFENEAAVSASVMQGKRRKKLKRKVKMKYRRRRKLMREESVESKTQDEVMLSNSAERTANTSEMKSQEETKAVPAKKKLFSLIPVHQA
eukprot:TRINITY_DN7828_c0_g3_i5.p1 TRINITY_DN7828_c0_g3~~TRINITY_DN7828_c0_g3_i5.p1  ORF type:complete len:591 (-),score=136.80 TRINITY_DN7828_c0_g3_i5:499-2271(-)